MNELKERIAQLYVQQNELEQQINKSLTAVYLDISPVAALEKLIAKHEEKELPAKGLNMLMDQLVDRFVPVSNVFNSFIKQFISKKVVAKIFDKKPATVTSTKTAPIEKQPTKKYSYDRTYLFPEF
jgi:hypothetical protein